MPRCFSTLLELPTLFWCHALSPLLEHSRMLLMLASWLSLGTFQHALFATLWTFSWNIPAGFASSLPLLFRDLRTLGSAVVCYDWLDHGGSTKNRYSMRFCFVPISAFFESRVYILRFFEMSTSQVFGPFSMFFPFRPFQIFEFSGFHSFFAFFVFSDFCIFGFSSIFQTFRLFRFSRFPVFAHFLYFSDFQILAFSRDPVTKSELTHFTFSRFPVPPAATRLFEFSRFRVFRSPLHQSPKHDDTEIQNTVCLSVCRSVGLYVCMYACMYVYIWYGMVWYGMVWGYVCMYVNVCNVMWCDVM